MIENLVFIFLILVFILASYEDIKKREVYDYLNFFFVFLIIIIALFDTLLSNSINPLKYVGFGLIIGFTIGSILYYLGIWGGGDAKFLIGFCGSVYYIKDFANDTLNLSGIYDYILSGLYNILTMFLDIFLKFILILDVIFILIIFIMFFLNKNSRRNEMKSLFYLLLIFFTLFLGLYFKYDNLTLVFLGVFAFILIFFADDYVFSSVYIKIKKKIHLLDEYDIVDSEIKHLGKVVVSYEDSIKGLSKENILAIKENISENGFIHVRKIMPYSILVGLNYLVYVIKIITVDEINLSMLSFILQFMLYSFIAGGIISLLLITYFYFKNYSKYGVIFSRVEKFNIYLVSAAIILSSIIITKLIFLMALPFFYMLIKIAKRVEKHMFVKKKPVENIVPGDWIAEDIVVNGKTIYSVENFKLGVEENQIKRIKELSEKHDNLKNIYVKDGLAFLPPLFIGFLLILFL